MAEPEPIVLRGTFVDAIDEALRRQLDVRVMRMHPLVCAALKDKLPAVESGGLLQMASIFEIRIVTDELMPVGYLELECAERIDPAHALAILTRLTEGAQA